MCARSHGQQMKEPCGQGTPPQPQLLDRSSRFLPTTSSKETGEYWNRVADRKGWCCPLYFFSANLPSEAQNLVLDTEPGTHSRRVRPEAVGRVCRFTEDKKEGLTWGWLPKQLILNSPISQLVHSKLASTLWVCADTPAAPLLAPPAFPLPPSVLFHILPAFLPYPLFCNPAPSVKQTLSPTCSAAATRLHPILLCFLQNGNTGLLFLPDYESNCPVVLKKTCKYLKWKVKVVSHPTTR